MHAFIGYLDNIPVSVFVGEKLSCKRFGLYTPITLRDYEDFSKNISGSATFMTDKGFTAMPVFAYFKLFENLVKLGFEEIHLGAKPDPTYWVIKLKKQ